MIDLLSLAVLASSCVLTSTPADVVASVAMVQSEGRPYDVGLDGNLFRHESKEAAIATITEGLINGRYVTFGLSQITIAHAEEAGFTPADGLSLCINLKILGDVLEGLHSYAPDSARPWSSVAALYATGTGEGPIAAQYITHIEEVRARLKGLDGWAGQQGLTTPPAALEAPNIADADVSAEAAPRASVELPWDIFQATRGQSVLVFQGNNE